MAQEQDKMPPIEPPSERWEPQADPSQIEVPELNTSAPPHEQLEQLDQIITIRLQVSEQSILYTQHETKGCAEH